MEAKEVDDWANLGTSYISVCCFSFGLQVRIFHTQEKKKEKMLIRCSMLEGGDD